MAYRSRRGMGAGANTGADDATLQARAAATAAYLAEQAARENPPLTNVGIPVGAKWAYYPVDVVKMIGENCIDPKAASCKGDPRIPWSMGIPATGVTYNPTAHKNNYLFQGTWYIPSDSAAPVNAAAAGVMPWAPGSVPVGAAVPVSPNYASYGLPDAAPFSFSTSRGSSAAVVGDTWVINITGAAPNAPVTVSGSMPSGSFSGSSMGKTDGSGNFSKSGTFDSSTIGSWVENWMVGGAPVGSISFTVSAVQTTPDGKQVIKSSGADNAPGSDAPAGSPGPSGFDLSSIPWWGWAIAAGGALLVFGRAK